MGMLAGAAYIDILPWTRQTFPHYFFFVSQEIRVPLFPLLFACGTAAIFFHPLKNSLWRRITRVLFPTPYDPEKILEETSSFLTSTLARDDILTYIWNTISHTLGIAIGAIFLRTTEKKHYLVAFSSAPLPPLLFVAPSLIQEIRRQGRIFSVSDLTKALASPNVHERQKNQATMNAIGARLLVPLILKGEVLGFITLGPKEDGTSFSNVDIDLLHSIANQSALSIANALSYQEIHDLNAELQDSLIQLEKAYSDLQLSQEHLARSERLADLGRLTAGIAHEMNTPLGASLASCKVMLDLIVEYKKSIDDPEVSAADHHEIAAEMENLVHNTQRWTEQTVAYIHSLKLQTRNLRQSQETDFSILQSIEDTKLILSHRLRSSHCTVTVTCTAAIPVLHGDPGKFEQVLTNLIENAIDAYQDAVTPGGDVHVAVTENSEGIEVRVRDQACGIPQEQLEKIFDDLFTTKPLGEGTGLGLPIARDIVTKFFQGTIQVESTLGQGTTFILRFPHRHEKAEIETLIAVDEAFSRS